MENFSYGELLFTDEIMTKDKIYLTENDELVKINI